MMKKQFFLLSFVFLFSINILPLIAQTKLIIATPGFEHPIAMVAAKVLPEAYKQLGYDIEFKVLPPKRAEAVFDDGTVDGYIFADQDFMKRHPTAIQVVSPIGSDDIMVFSKKDLKINDWNSLKPYTIGYQIGMAVIETNIQGMKLEASQDPPEAFRKLAYNRSDVLLMPRGIGLIMLKDQNYQDIKMLKTPLAKVELYHFLTSKRSDLALKLANVISDMTKSGRIKTITDQVEKSFLK